MLSRLWVNGKATELAKKIDEVISLGKYDISVKEAGVRFTLSSVQSVA